MHQTKVIKPMHGHKKNLRAVVNRISKRNQMDYYYCSAQLTKIHNFKALDIIRQKRKGETCFNGM